MNWGIAAHRGAVGFAITAGVRVKLWNPANCTFIVKKAQLVTILACLVGEAKKALDTGDIETAKAALERAESEFKKGGGWTTQTIPGKKPAPMQ